MAEHNDWVDRTMAQSAWEPPDGFTDRVVLRSMAALPRRVSFRDQIAATVGGVCDSLRARLEGTVWVVRQYRDLILHS
jgi:hypothetical protein